MSDFIYLCPECGTCFSSETSLQEHDLAVHSSQNHICHVCHKILKSLALLERHMTAHQNLLHCCNICGELCENKVDVYVHVTTSHKYGGKMVCDLCSKIFPTNSSLKVHSINKHAVEMPHVMQKWELFCNVHSSQNLCGSDALKDSFHPSDDCPLHPKEDESRGETNSVRLSDVSTSNQSILLSEKRDDTERPRDCLGSALTELQIFLQEQAGDKGTWYAYSTDHLNSGIWPNDILERVQISTQSKNQDKDQQIECHFCNTTFKNRNDYLLAHDGKDPANIYPHKEEEKPESQTRLQDLFGFCKFIAGNMSHVPLKKRAKKQLPAAKTVVIHPDRNARSENQNDQLEPNGTLLLSEMALPSQIQNKNAKDVNQNDQLEPNDTLLAEISALTSQIQNENESYENQNDQLERNGTMLVEISALTIQNKSEKDSDVNQNDLLEPNGTMLADISALTI